MPKRYEAIRDDCMKKGGKTKACKTKAAKIENSLRRKEDKPPMTHGPRVAKLTRKS